METFSKEQHEIFNKYISGKNFISFQIDSSISSGQRMTIFMISLRSEDLRGRIIPGAFLILPHIIIWSLKSILLFCMVFMTVIFYRLWSGVSSGMPCIINLIATIRYRRCFNFLNCTIQSFKYFRKFSPEFPFAASYGNQEIR